MNIETPPPSSYENEHLALCEQLKARKIASTQVVAALRKSVEGLDWTGQSAKAQKLFKKEHLIFKEKAAAAIDRRLPPSDKGTPASQLKLNKGLLSFVSVVTPNIRLRARAGSGKSTALIIKCDFLINDLGVPPEAIQLLTFNRAAAEKLSKDMCNALGEETGKKIGINTFHSLAFHVLKQNPDTSRLTLHFSDDDRSERDQIIDLAKTTREVTLPRDLDAYRQRYARSEHSYLTRKDDFDDFVRRHATKAAILYRARRGAPQAIPANAITRHIERIAEAYDDRLSKTFSADGEMGLRKAAVLIKSGAELPLFKRITGKLQFLFVDEFQDFSPAFSDLTQALMTRNPTCVLNGVGDDWQSINAFMGAEPSLFKNLKSSYPASLNLSLQSNWRCGKRIVELGNCVMKAEEKVAAVPAVSHDGRVRVLVGGVEERQWQSDWHPQSKGYLERQINRMAQAAWADDARAKREPGSIAVLASSNKVFGEELSYYAGLIDRSDGGVVECSTVHSSKGIEWDHVILIDAVKSNYPSSHPAEPIQKDIFSDTARQDEGQRLLYVGVTRAKYSAALIAPTELHPMLASARELSKR